MQTRTLISQEPPVYVIDTPGIMLPKLDDVDIAMRLALCGRGVVAESSSLPSIRLIVSSPPPPLPPLHLGTLRDELVGEEYLADYLLYTLNRLGHMDYVDRYAMAGPVDSIEELLVHVAQRRGHLGPGGCCGGGGFLTHLTPLPFPPPG